MTTSPDPFFSEPQSWRPESGSPAGQVHGPKWRWEAGTTARRPGRRARRLRIVLLYLSLIAIVALVVWVSLWLRPAQGTCLVLIGAGYEDNLAVPHNVYGREGLKALAKLARQEHPGFAWRSGRLRVQNPPRELTSIEEWDKGLKNIPEKTVVVFLALHGGVDQQGAYLLPQRALLPLAHSPKEPDLSRLRLEKVLERLANMPRHQHVVLILDATQVTADWSLGMLQNDFARALERLDARIAAIPNLIVLSASAPEQRSWASDELQQTVFSHYLIEGLQGAADGAGDDARDGRISALELHRYVARQVERWAAVNRGAKQTPVLFPSGVVGEARAREFKLTVAPRQAAPAPGLRPVFEPPASLLAAWQDCDRLAKQVPPPATCSPHLWQQYQQTLLRYEQLLQVGDAEGPRLLAGRLRALAQAITEARQMPLESVLNSLAMPALSGAETVQTKTLRDSFAKLWTAPPDKIAETWAQLNTEHNPTGDKLRGQMLRLRCAEMLLREVTRDLAGQRLPQALEHAYKLLRLTEEPISPHRSAEAHYLVMLRNYLPRLTAEADSKTLVLRPESLQLALRVRLHAERAALGMQGNGDSDGPSQRHCYAEQVHLWIRPLIEDADARRRLGQDLLFATDAQHRQAGEDLLAQADRGYAKAQQGAERVRRALAVRDQVFGALPFYAHWVARRREIVASPDQPRPKQTLLEKFEQLCEAAHTLARSLESAAVTPPANVAAKAPVGEVPAWPGLDAATAEVQAQADEVRRAFQELEGQFTQHRDSLEQADRPSIWTDMDDVLVVPFSDTRVRQVLLTRRSRIAQRLLLEPGGGEPPAAFNVQDTACCEGRLALALLGKRWFDESNPERVGYEEMLRRLTRPGATGDWQESLTAAGDELGRRWHALPKEISRLLSASQAGGVVHARAVLRAADRLARHTDAVGSLYLSENAATAYRRVMAQDLLVWQAERTYLDHWFDEDPAKEPYYTAAGRAYLGDAERLGPTHPAVAELKQKLQPARLEVVLHTAPGFDGKAAPPLLHLTSEEEFPLQYRLKAVGGAMLPVGNPVVWVETGPALEIVGFAGGGALGASAAAADLSVRETINRQARQVLPWSEKGDKLLACTLRSPLPGQAEANPPAAPKPTETAVTVRGFYRGQPLQVRTRLDVHPLADNILVNHTLPPRASIAVRAPGLVHERFGVNTGALVIVLDCSGSMGPPAKQEFSDKTKFARATSALRQVLRKVPRGTVVSLWVFGQALGFEKTVQKAEETILRVQEPVVWDPDDQVRADGLMSRIEWPALEPWNESPIIRTMIQAARRDLRDGRGYKSMLVITDGMDNRFDKDAEYNGDGKDLRTVFREEFRDIEVNVIGFKVTSKEMEKAKEQFQVVETLPRAGKFYLVNEAVDLVRTMEKVLRQRMRYWVDREDDLPLRGVGGELYASQDDANDQWLPGALAPGSYKVRVRSGRDYARSIALDQGDLMLLEVGPDRRPGAEPSALDFRRLLYSETYHGGKPKKDQGRWRAAVLQNQWLPSQRLQMLLALERRDDPEVLTLRQVRPVMTWVEVAPPPGVKVPFCQRWYYQAGYPAPTWNIDVPAWPTRGGAEGLPARPELRVWWSPDLEPSGVALERGHDFMLGPQEIVNKAFSLRKRVQSMDDEPIVVESVRFEDHIVETRPAYRDRAAKFEKMPCLVVRVSHNKERPVLIRPVGMPLGGDEHRYYKEAGKYTALFWPVPPGGAQALQRLEIISLTGFKASATQREFTLHMDNLYDPQPADIRPPFPVDLSSGVAEQSAAVPKIETPRPAGPPVAPPAILPRPVPTLPAGQQSSTPSPGGGQGGFLLELPGQLPVLPNTSLVAPEGEPQELGDSPLVGPVVKPRLDLRLPWLPGPLRP